MTLRETDELVKSYTRLRAELARIEQPPIGRGSMELAHQAGDIFLVDDSDDERTDERGVFAWITADDWREPTELHAFQIWGPSMHLDGRARHLGILVDVCQWGVDLDGDERFSHFPRPFADMPIFYTRQGHVLTVLADSLLVPAGVARISPDGRRTTTTLRRALPVLQGGLVAVRR